MNHWTSIIKTCRDFNEEEMIEFLADIWEYIQIYFETNEDHMVEKCIYALMLLMKAVSKSLTPPDFEIIIYIILIIIFIQAEKSDEGIVRNMMDEMPEHIQEFMKDLPRSLNENHDKDLIKWIDKRLKKIEKREKDGRSSSRFYKLVVDCHLPQTDNE